MLIAVDVNDDTGGRVLDALKFLFLNHIKTIMIKVYLNHFYQSSLLFQTLICHCLFQNRQSQTMCVEVWVAT